MLLKIRYITLLLGIFTSLYSVAQCEVDAGNNVTICQGESVVLGGSPTVDTANPPYTITWDNGANDEDNPSVSPNSTTTYTVNIEDDDGCTDSDQITVTVLPSPSASFTFAPDGECSTIPISFINGSTGNNLDYDWDFGNPASPDNSSTALNPTHEFVATGGGSEIFTVTLTVTDNNGCTDTFTDAVTVDQSPEPILIDPISEFRNCDGNPEFTLTVYDQTQPGSNANYVIEWGDATPDYNSSNAPVGGETHTYDGLGIYTLNYTVTGNNGCVNSTEYLVSNITNPAIGAANPGNTNDCGPIEICFPLSNFEANHSSTTYNVDWGDGSPVENLNHPPPTEICHTYTTSSCETPEQSYTFTITANNTCDVSIATIQPVRIYTGPIVNFTADPVPACVNSGVLFENLSIQGFNQQCNATTIFTWDFGDGSDPVTVFDLGSQSHAYSDPGTYTVSLTGTNGCGTDSAELEVCIETAPTPSFTLSDQLGCLPLQSEVTNLSDDGIPCSLGRNWIIDYTDDSCAPNSGAFNFINGTNGASLEPDFEFLSAGTYYVTLQMINSCGIFEETLPVTVNTTPELLVNAVPDICAGESVNPSAIVDDCNEVITEYDWSFPGGAPNSSNTLNPGSVTYNSSGNFTLTLEATNACGSSQASTGIFVEQSPTVTITTDALNNTACEGESVLLTANGASSYTWTFDPTLNSTVGSPVTANPVTQTTYTVTGTSPIGCSGIGTVTVDVNEAPIPTANGLFEICAGESVQLDVNIAGGTPPYVSYSWSPAGTLDDASDPNPNANPLITTDYTVTVTDNANCDGQGIVTVIVNQLPIVNAGPDIQLCNQAVPEVLTGFSPTTGGTGIWTGPGITDDSGEFTPFAIGFFDLTYTFEDDNGCVNQDEMTIEVIEPATADAGPDLEFCDSPIAVQLATIGNGNWSGNNVTPEGMFTPSPPDTYILTYSIGGGSCLSTDQMEIVVNELPTLTMDPDETICSGDSVQLGAAVSGGQAPYASYAWSPGGSLSDPAIINPWANPGSTTNYTLTVTDDNTCSASGMQTVTIEASPLVEAGPNLILCNQPVPEVLAGFSPTAGGTGVWTGSGITDDQGEFTPSGIGQFILTYTFTSDNGCEASDSIYVDVLDPTPADAGLDSTVCLDADPVILDGLGTWDGEYTDPAGIFTPSEIGDFVLTLTFGTGSCETQDDVMITVVELPFAEAGMDETICEGESVQLFGEGISNYPPITVYSWTGDDGLSANNVQNPIASPTETSTYNFTIVDAQGCEGHDQLTVNVNPLPAVEAGPDLTLCDQAIEEQLTGFSPLPDIDETAEWYGPGITDPSGSFLSPGVGQYTVYYEFTDPFGCTNTDSLVIDVVEPVIVDAGPDEAICFNNGLYQLENFNPLLGGIWSGDGIVDPVNGVFDPLVSGDGLFTLYLEYGSGTCYSIDSVEIEVYALPILNAGADEEVCGNLPPFDLSGFDPPLGTWEGIGIIDEAQGTFDPAIGEGNYPLIYHFSDPLTGCADTVDKLIIVHPFPEALMDLAPLGCTDADVDATNNSAGAIDYEWIYGNGDTLTGFYPPYIYIDEGFYDLTLVAFNEFTCSDTTLGTIEVIDPPSAVLGLSPSEGCAPLEVSFSNGSVGQYLEYSWDLAITTSTDPVPANQIYEQGDDILEYPIELSATNFCGTAVDQDIITVLPQPVAGFGTNLDVFCSPFTVEINNISVGNPDTFEWDFGDLSTSSLEEPGNHIYTTDSLPSDYTITLITTNECGIDTFDYTITVLPNTVTAFFNTNITEGCQPLEVEFTDFSEGGDVISWNFGDDEISDEVSPTHIFTEPGEYTIYQFVNNGCSFDTTSIQVEVFPGPDLDFTTDLPVVCEDQFVQFINLSEDVSDVEWDFGDTNTSEETNPFHVYEDGGTYTVTLTGLSMFNECPGEVQQTFPVNPSPEAVFSVDDNIGCSPFTVQFDNDSFDGDFFLWDFDGTNSSVDDEPAFTFINETGDPLLYEVSLIVQNEVLCADTFLLDIIVSPTPVAEFFLPEWTSCYSPVNLSFDNNSVYADDYEWDFGPFGSSELFEPELELLGVGEWDVEMTASNAYGCSDLTTGTFEIYPLPEASFMASPEAGCSPLIVNFSNSSLLGFSYEWEFGDFTSSDLPNPNHAFVLPGLYDITLMVESGDGCRDTLLVEDMIEVFPLPVADFTMDQNQTTVYDPEIEFTDQSFDASQWFWSFGDGGVSGEQNPSHVYTEAGFFQIELIVINEHGCQSLYRDELIIEDDFNIYVPNTFTPDGDGINDEFLPSLRGGLIDFYEFKIFDRWGQKIFETNELGVPWIGDHTDGDYYVQDDVYVWQVKVRLIGGDKSKYYHGHVTIIR